MEEGPEGGLGESEAGQERLGKLGGGELAGEERLTEGEDLRCWG